MSDQAKVDEVIASRFCAGESIQRLAYDYGIGADGVTEAIRRVLATLFDGVGP